MRCDGYDVNVVETLLSFSTSMYFIYFLLLLLLLLVNGYIADELVSGRLNE